MKCYTSAKYHYLKHPPSPPRTCAADAGEKWPTGKTPVKFNTCVYPKVSPGKRCKDGLKSSPHRNRNDFSHSIYPPKGHRRALREPTHLSQTGTALLVTAQQEEGECLALVTVSEICGNFPSRLQILNQKNRNISLSSSLPPVTAPHGPTSPAWFNKPRTSTAT